MHFILKPGTLTYADLKQLQNPDIKLSLDEAAKEKIQRSAEYVAKIIHTNKVAYGVNTGFGALAHKKISTSEVELLQKSIILSHATGTGALLPDSIVRLILILKINSLAMGYSGVKLSTLEGLIAFLNHGIYPCTPEKGSVGASGDLAPLAHLCIPLIGEGMVRFQDECMPAKDALQSIGLAPIQLAPKEGLALVNGTQVSTGLALAALIRAENVFKTALCAGAMSVDGIKASDIPFDARIHSLRPYPEQILSAKLLTDLLKGSEIRSSHVDCEKVQDPYSFRCQAQVMGAVLSQIRHAAETILIESNAVSDNPLIFAEDNVILSGGNFHAEPIAFAADNLAIAISEIGAISERRTAIMIDPTFTKLPPFLVNNSGVNSGFMLAQVTAAALASENKTLAHPASVDSIPTSLNQEDHVSMATFGARRLTDILDNVETILAIELLAAAQALDFHRPLKSSPSLEKLYHLIRQEVPFYEQDRFFAPDIAKIIKLVHTGKVHESIDLNIF